jgi:hypothetical protein
MWRAQIATEFLNRLFRPAAANHNMASLRKLTRHRQSKPTRDAGYQNSSFIPNKSHAEGG